jgi:NADH-ubiquinone oxidoreductase chain 2
MLLTFLFLLVISTGLTLRPDTSILYNRIGITIILYILLSSYVSFYIEYISKGISLYNGLFNASSIGHMFSIFLILITGLIILITSYYARKIDVIKYTNKLITLLKKSREYSTVINKTSEQFTIIEYTLILMFAVTGAILLLSSADLGSVYLCIELQSFSLYIISAIYRNSESSVAAALMYFLLGGLSSCVILLGITIIYTNSGLTNLDSIYSIISDSIKYMDYSLWYFNNYTFYSLLLISIGFLFKISAAPFHWWSPDVYDGVPTIVTTFIAIIGKIAILILLLELIHYGSTLSYSNYQIYSWIYSISLSCFFSLIIGTVLGLTQTRIKRLLAYSTISHIGFILLGLIVHTIESYQSFMFYIFQYILTNLNAFIILLSIGYSLYFYYTNISEYNNLSEKNNSPIQLINQIKGYFSINPAVAFCLVITMFSFIGLPPLIGFFAKQMTLSTALDNQKSLLVITGVFSSVIGAVYYLTVIKTIYFDKSDYLKIETYGQVSISSAYSITLAIINLIIIFFILISNEIITLSSLLAITSFG